MAINPAVTNAVKTEIELYNIDYVGTDNFPYLIGNIYSLSPTITRVTVKGSPALNGVGTPIYTVLSPTGIVSDVQGAGPWTATISGMTSVVGLQTGDYIVSIADTGELSYGFVTQILGNTSIKVQVDPGPFPWEPPFAPMEGTITNISNLTSAQKATVPPGFVSGTKILITGVQGMTELATAGENGTNLFYIGVNGNQNFDLYTDPELTIPVDSTGFTPAVANTGQYNVFNVTEFTSPGNTINVIYDNFEAVGSEIDLNFSTGEFDCAENYTYTFSAIGYLSGTNYNDGIVPTYQWYNVTTEEFVGNPAPIGTRVAYTVTLGSPTIFQLRAMAPNGTSWNYPAKLINITATAQMVSGFNT